MLFASLNFVCNSAHSSRRFYMTDNPSIIACGGLVFVTTRFPHGPALELVPSMTDQNEIGVEVGLRATHDNEYFIVTVSNWIRPGQSDPSESAWDEKVRRVLQHVWWEMRICEIVEGPMPEIIKGNPLDMLPK